MSYPTSSPRVQFAPNTLAPPTERRSLRSPPPKSRPQPRPQHQHQQHQHQQPPRRQPHQGYGPGCKLISLREAQARPEIVYRAASPALFPEITLKDATALGPSCVGGGRMRSRMMAPLLLLVLSSTSDVHLSNTIHRSLASSSLNNNQSYRRSYAEEIQLELPIPFFTTDPVGLGFPLTDAIRGWSTRLIDRDDPMFPGRGPSVSIKLNNVAKVIKRFIDECEGITLEEDDNDDGKTRWHVDTGCGDNEGIRLEDLMLLGLQHVSMGSWQAHVRLISPKKLNVEGVSEDCVGNAS
ncbi:hypothetical protein C8Q78DRAFT_1073388 [Trametes maxima]|nr:hypothetical protein C8Q78DRAFT_1073388 [Trametes maxima]